MEKAHKRNSLIELYRFIFAFNVVKNHGFFPISTPYFSPGRISVEFFFVLTGWLMLRSIDKFLEQPYWKGLFGLLKQKLKVLGIPLLVGLIFNIAYKIVVGMEVWYDISIWGYLWYVHDMLIVFIFYYTIRKFVKSKKAFIAIVTSVFVITSVLHVIPACYTNGYFRAFSAMSAGMLISFLPKMQKKWQAWIPLILVQMFVLRMLLFDFGAVEDEILNIIMYPALIYFTFQVDVHFAVFDYLGALSFGMYAYQSVPRFIRVLGYDNSAIFFLIIMVLAICTDLIKRIVQKVKNGTDPRILAV